MKFIFGRELNLGEIYDREKEINEIIRSFDTRQPLAVIGYRRMGKSSILNAAKSLLENNNVIVVKFNLEGILNLSDYSNRLINSLIDSISQKYKLKYYKEEIRRKLNMFIGSIEQIGLKFNNFEFTLKRYNDFLENRLKASEIIENIIDLPEKFAEDLNIKIMVMIDEFQYIRMLKEPFPYILRLMRSKFNEHKNVNYVISGSEMGILNEMLNSKNEPFYAFFKTIEIKSFSHGQSIDFLMAGLKTDGIKCNHEILEKIYNITSGIPAWLNLAGIDLINGKCDVNYFLKDATYKNIINFELNSLTKNEMTLMKLLSEDIPMKEIKLSNKYRVLKSLINKGLVFNINDKYELSDSLVKYYINNAYAGKK